MRKKQEYFTPSDDELIPVILEIAQRERRSLSEMIDILLHQAVKERLRKRAKKDNSQYNSPNMVQGNTE